MTIDSQDSEKKSDAGVNNGQQPEQESKKSLVVTQWRLIIIFILILAVAGMYTWKNMAVKRAKADLTEQATRIITEQNSTFLRLVTVPLVWAVRSEMIRSNYDQINQYLTQFVKEKNMKEIVIAKPDGTIVVATNKKFEGKPVTDIFPASVLQEDKLTVSSLENGDIMVASPVMGLSSKVGVLILLYTPASYNLQAR